MTALLASVASLAEAEIALKVGADVIDLKNPSRGALGAWDHHALASAIKRIAGRRAISATVGDLPMTAEILAAAVAKTAASGVDFVKVGFFHGGEPFACIDALSDGAGEGAGLVAVLFADQQPDFALLDPLAEGGFAGVMLDTADKKAGGLRACLDDVALARFVDAAAARGLMSGLAGSLTAGDVGPLLDIGPDYLGFRGALCGRGDRQAKLDENRLKEMIGLFQAGNASALNHATATAGAQVAASSLRS